MKNLLITLILAATILLGCEKDPVKPTLTPEERARRCDYYTKIENRIFTIEPTQRDSNGKTVWVLRTLNLDTIYPLPLNDGGYYNWHTTTDDAHFYYLLDSIRADHHYYKSLYCD